MENLTAFQHEALSHMTTEYQRLPDLREAMGILSDPWRDLRDMGLVERAEDQLIVNGIKVGTKVFYRLVSSALCPGCKSADRVAGGRFCAACERGK
jgi:hypothetical protein